MTIVAHDVGGIGGMERQLTALISRLLDLGIEVTVVSRTLGLPAHPRLRWRRVPGPGRPFAVAYPWFGVIATVMLAWRRSGLLHTTGSIVLNRSDLCTVHYVHNGRDASVQRTQRATVPYRLNAALAQMLSRAGERLVYSSASLSRNLVAVSEAVADELRLAFPNRAGSILVVGNGVDAERFRPNDKSRRDVRRELGIADSLPLALFVGSDWRRKGLSVAVEALSAATDWHLAVVGRGDTEEVSSLARRLRVADRLHLLAESSRPERYYAAADAFVLPSAYETFSLAAFEAAASGLPVLTTKVGAVGEIVGAGGGIFVDRSPDSVAAALRDLQAEPRRAANMSESARTAAQRFDWDTVVQNYLNLYRSEHHRPQSPMTSPVPE